MGTQVTTNGATQPAAPASFSEAPASVNVFATSPAGFTYQLTMRAARVADVLSQAAQLESWLTSHNWTPGKPASKASQGDAVNSVPGETPLCPTHQKPMKPGKNGGWYCPVKLLEDDGTGKPVYCKQRK